jgi:hypothetical protein
MVAALGNRNETVRVIDAVRRSIARSAPRCVLVPGLDHAHGSVPAPERGHVPERDHEHGHGPSHAKFDRPF